MDVCLTEFNEKLYTEGLKAEEKVGYRKWSKSQTVS